jgi:two-component system NtrC family response regulator
MKPTLLIVDDDEGICSQLKWGLTENYEVLEAREAASGLARFLEQRPAAVLLDLGLPPSPGDSREGLKLLGQLLEADPHCKVIIATGQAERANALKAIGGGAYDYLTKPVDIEDLDRILRRALHVSEIEREHAALQQQFMGEPFEGLLGNSTAMESVRVFIRKVAPTEAPVLVLGESGTGKEMTARAIHRHSPRHAGPFLAINCGAIPQDLLESELFGHEKGAFTGAVGRRRGRVEAASGGTLFLDEVGELSPVLQVKLLRFLQDRCITRVGGNEEIPVDVRVMAATNADLAARVRSQAFREDLYYRLAVVVLQLPPLRDRAGDVPFLALAFLHQLSRDHNRRNLRFARAALDAMERYHWPGNVRELQNRVRRAIIMTEGRQISAGDLGLDGVYSAPVSLREARERTERMLVQQALRRNRGNMTATAQDLGISRPTLYELMEKLGMRRETLEWTS